MKDYSNTDPDWGEAGEAKPQLVLIVVFAAYCLVTALAWWTGLPFHPIYPVDLDMIVRASTARRVTFRSQPPRKSA